MTKDESVPGSMLRCRCNADHSKCGIFQGVSGKADVRSGAPSDMGTRLGTVGYTAYTIGDDGAF